MNKLFDFEDPRFPLTAITAKWISSRILSDEDRASCELNEKQNPDIRVRETCRVLLRAATDGEGDYGGPIDLLRAKTTPKHGVARHNFPKL